ncbi:hypothetical protein BGW42_005933 [Actinomortierella wolfii]|nr:hypothetical protein BGW42_005933 [Actinomortierella wolfii]
MAKDGFLTPKAIANRIKAKGLQKLRWYCQVCEKQCRDENGFKCHLESESHQRRILLVAESPEKYINSYSAEFQSEFMKLLSTRYGTRRVQANHVYQEYISDRQHLHMNATKWTTLTEFVKHLGKEGLAIVDETPKGWFIQWIDRSPKALARQEAIAKKERMELDDEQREQKMIQEQMARAAAAQQTKTEADKPDDSLKELVRENEEEKIKLNLSLKPAAGSTTSKSGGGLLGSGSLLKPKSLNALATKKPNPLKSASASASSKSALPSNLTSTTSPAQSETTSTSTTPSATFPSETRKHAAVEENMDQEVARKRRFTSSEETGKDQGDSKRASSSSSYSHDDHSRERDRTGDYERNRDRRRDDDRDRTRDYGHDREKYRDRAYDQERYDRDRRRDDDRDRHRDGDRDRYRDYDRERDRDRHSSRDYDRHRERDRRDQY